MKRRNFISGLLAEQEITNELEHGRPLPIGANYKFLVDDEIVADCRKRRFREAKTQPHGFGQSTRQATPEEQQRFYSNLQDTYKRVFDNFPK